jgi:hypothetical protein
MRPAWLAIALSVLIPTAASSKAIFSPHQNGLAVLHGDGGKSMRSHGIMVWTKGMPRSSFRIIGVIQDKHTSKSLAGRRVGSPVDAAVADLVRAHGGDAVLVRDAAATLVDVERRSVSGVPTTSSFSDQGDVLVHEVASWLVVIKSNVNT